MPKIIPMALFMVLLWLLAVALGEAADTSRAARSVVVAIFVVALSVVASLVVALLVRRWGPHTVNHYHDNRSIVMHQDAPAAQAPQIDEQTRSVTKWN